jgi:hypothetical protein
MSLLINTMIFIATGGGLSALTCLSAYVHALRKHAGAKPRLTPANDNEDYER